MILFWARVFTCSPRQLSSISSVLISRNAMSPTGNLTLTSRKWILESHDSKRAYSVLLQRIVFLLMHFSTIYIVLLKYWKLIFVAVILAIAIPDLELFISLIGALCLSTMGLSFPALLQLFTFWNEYEGVQFVLFFLKNLTIILIALLGFLVGTATSVQAIIVKFFAPLWLIISWHPFFLIGWCSVFCGCI